MFFIYFIAIAFIFDAAHLQTPITNPCTPSQTDLDDDNSFFAHPIEENKFIRCDHSGIMHEFTCAFPLKWNNNLKQCDKAAGKTLERIHMNANDLLMRRLESVQSTVPTVSSTNNLNSQLQKPSAKPMTSQKSNTFSMSQKKSLQTPNMINTLQVDSPLLVDTKQIDKVTTATLKPIQMIDNNRRVGMVRQKQVTTPIPVMMEDVVSENIMTNNVPVSPESFTVMQPSKQTAITSAGQVKKMNKMTNGRIVSMEVATTTLRPISQPFIPEMEVDNSLPITDPFFATNPLNNLPIDSLTFEAMQGNKQTAATTTSPMQIVSNSKMVGAARPFQRMTTTSTTTTVAPQISENIRLPVDNRINKMPTGRKTSNGRIGVPSTMEVTSTTTQRMPLNGAIPSMTTGSCNSVTVSGSRMPLVNGLYNQMTIDNSGLAIYRRTGSRPSLIVSLPNVWCVTMSFMMFDVSKMQSADIQANCANNECCLLISEKSETTSSLFESSRQWTINVLESKGKSDSNIVFKCSDSLIPSIDTNDEIVQSPKPVEISRPVQIPRPTNTQIPIDTPKPIETTRSMQKPIVFSNRKQQTVMKTLQTTEIKCDMVTCPANHDCLTKVNCMGCNPICNPFNNKDLTKIKEITCQNVNCPIGMTCSTDNGSVQCVSL